MAAVNGGPLRRRQARSSVVTVSRPTPGEATTGRPSLAPSARPAAITGAWCRSRGPTAPTCAVDKDRRAFNTAGTGGRLISHGQQAGAASVAGAQARPWQRLGSARAPRSRQAGRWAAARRRHVHAASPVGAPASTAKAACAPSAARPARGRGGAAAAGAAQPVRSRERCDAGDEHLGRARSTWPARLAGPTDAAATARRSAG